MNMNAIKTRLEILLAVLAVLVFVGTVGFMMIEGVSLLDAFYFVVVTIGTVGYGDVHPVTAGGKIFTLFLIVMGVGTFLGVIANMTEIILARREVESKMAKLNIVIGVFFSEVGLHLLSLIPAYDPGFERIRSDLVVTGRWKDESFHEVSEHLRRYRYDIRMEFVDMDSLRSFLGERRDFLVRLLENPNLLEHETFSDLLRAVFHLMEELLYRVGTTDLPQADVMHLALDIERVFGLLIVEWLSYMQYLKGNYPFLFSLAVRTNPFDRAATVIVTEI